MGSASSLDNSSLPLPKVLDFVSVQSVFVVPLFPLSSSKALPMKGSILSWLLLAISTISIISDVAAASASASAQCLGDDQISLLLELKNSLVFEASASSKLVQWDRSANSWSGVTCEDGLVVGLDLSDESISGGIDGSSSLFMFEFLRSLNLASNHFNSSAIPSELANLSRLAYLDLSSTGFAGQIPAELSRLTKLRTLDLSDNFLILEKPNLRSLIGNLGELRGLYLDLVNMSTEGSEWCDALSSSVPKLEVLSMAHCSLSGPIDASLTSLANLSVIQLDFNSLYTTIPTFLANFSRLKALTLSGCDLRGEIPQQVFQVRTLQTLDLSLNVDLQGRLPDFPENSSLEVLALMETNISGRLPYSIGNLRKLSALDMGECSLGGSIPSSLKNLLELTYLDLSSNNLIGSIPSSMENLSKLTHLDLSSNNLTGSIPPYGASRNLTTIMLSGNALTGQITFLGWEDLLNLRVLDLRDNSLEGDIPPALFSLPQLMMIHLSNNRFSGQLIINPNVSSYQLKFLDLSSNQLRGSLPTSISELQGLEELSLSSNNFSGSMNIDVFRGSGNLAELDLSFSGLSINASSSASTVASSFPKFHSLSLVSCQLQKFPQFLTNQFELESLDLSHNCIQGEIQQWIWTLGMSFLDLSSNFFEGFEIAPRSIASDVPVLHLHSNRLQGNLLPFLLSVKPVYLDISDNNITSFIPDNIGDYQLDMHFFSLSKNNFHGFIPTSICKIGSDLEVLDLSHNHLNGTIPDCLMMESLKVLKLRNNQLTGHIPRNIPTSCSLNPLDISENSLYRQILLSLAKCTKLEIVNMGHNQIDGTFPCHFKAMSSLRVLVLQSNKLHGKIGCLHGPDTWKKLQIIDLSSNDFSGMLPASLLTSWEAMKADVDFKSLKYLLFGGYYYEETIRLSVKGLEVELVKILTIFTSIDFSGNRLEGPIPDTLGDLKALCFLNLSYNAISGSIPSVLGNLDQLQSLDLSRNYLNGTIPVQIANLHFLSFLNLSKNQLVGSIPTSGQFVTFSESSFLGNLGLCGLRLNKSCSITTNGTKENGDDSEDDDSEKTWFYLGIPLGFVVGFWIFYGPLVFIRSWRFAYYRFWNKVLFKHSCP